MKCLSLLAEIATALSFPIHDSGWTTGERLRCRVLLASTAFWRYVVQPLGSLLC